MENKFSLVKRMLIGADVLKEMRRMNVEREMSESELHEMLFDEDCLRLDKALAMGDLEYALIVLDQIVPQFYKEKEINKIVSLIKEQYHD